LDDPHVFVANHTSFIDFIVLSANKFPHATVSQNQGGLFGFFQKHILKLNGSINFNRADRNDRQLVSRKYFIIDCRMREHVHNVENSPLLIFPEGTCVNNEYTVLFHKGAFDLDAKVVPVAIKYDRNVVDAYWHSRVQSFSTHLLYLMTRWRLVADVWYLPPRLKRRDQTAVEFANEVKAEISNIAGLKNLHWDGYWKNFIPSMEKQETLKAKPRERFGRALLRRVASTNVLKLTRRQSFGELTAHNPSTDDFGTFFNNEQFQFPDPVSSTSLRNRALVDLQTHERQSYMMKLITSKVDDVVGVWKAIQRSKSDESSHKDRLEYISWRLWYKYGVFDPQKALDHDNVEPSVIELITDLLSLPGKTYCPNDVFESDLSSMEDISKPRRRLIGMSQFYEN
jgi:hypothetical protein